LPDGGGAGNFAPYLAVVCPKWVSLALSSALCTAIPGVMLGGCKAKTPAITEPFSDGFERAELGPTWLDTSGQGRVVNGQLVVSGGKNRPLWLRKRLPPAAVIELDAMSKSEDGDIKLELYGDGESFDADQGRYDPTGYVFVLGGWQNSLSIIGKLGEHDDGVKASRPHRRVPQPPPPVLAGPGAGEAPAAAPAPQGLEGPVTPGKVYHFTITRKGGQIDWKIDGAPFLSWTDPAPLSGATHEYLAITNWNAEVHIDNLEIRPAP
jgi:hypothetical protein